MDTIIGGEAVELTRRAREQRLRHDVRAFEEAVPLLREAIEREPTYAPAYAELAETYAAWGLRREDSCLGLRRETRSLEYESLYALAHDYADSAMRLAPQLSRSRRAMAAALRRGSRADPERREREAALAAEIDPDDPESQVELWRARGYDPDDPAPRRALEREPALLSARLDLASALCERGRYGDALRELEEALKRAPRNVQVYYDIAMLLERKGLRERALDMLRRAKALDFGDPLVRQGYALLGEAL